MKKLLSVLMAAALAGCVSMNTTMGSWVGRNIDDVTAAWGAPESRIDRRDGGATYTWTTTSGNRYGVGQCHQTFTTDANGTITGWSYNGCPKYRPK